MRQGPCRSGRSRRPRTPARWTRSTSSSSRSPSSSRILIAGLVVTFAVRYRRRSEDERPQAILGSLALELTWTLIPLGIVLVIFLWSAEVFFTIARVPPNAMEIFVVGKRWMWKAQHMTGQREINELHVPIGVPVKLIMGSEDVIHSFFIPAFRVKKDVVPGRYQTMWFQATRPGRYHLYCAEYCGTKHSQMIGSVVVMEPAAFQAWLGGGAAGLTMTAAGERHFQQLGCVTCHRADSGQRGPRLEGVFGKTVALARRRHGEGGRGVHPRVDREPVRARGGRLPADHADLPGARERGRPGPAGGVRALAGRGRGGRDGRGGGRGAGAPERRRQPAASPAGQTGREARPDGGR